MPGGASASELFGFRSGGVRFRAPLIHLLALLGSDAGDEGGSRPESARPESARPESARPAGTLLPSNARRDLFPGVSAPRSTPAAREVVSAHPFEGRVRIRGRTEGTCRPGAGGWGPGRRGSGSPWPFRSASASAPTGLSTTTPAPPSAASPSCLARGTGGPSIRHVGASAPARVGKPGRRARATSSEAPPARSSTVCRALAVGGVPRPPGPRRDPECTCRFDGTEREAG